VNVVNPLRRADREATESWESDLRRGLLQLLVLAIIKAEGPTFGYAIAQSIRQRTADRLILQDGTLYPLLHRLEHQKLVRSRWDVSGDRPRKYYQITPAGERQLQVMLAVWTDLVATLDPLFHSLQYGDAAGPKATSPPPAKFCPTCGAPIHPGAAFCAACGTPVMEE